MIPSGPEELDYSSQDKSWGFPEKLLNFPCFVKLRPSDLFYCVQASWNPPGLLLYGRDDEFAHIPCLLRGQELEAECC